MSTGPNRDSKLDEIIAQWRDCVGSESFDRATPGQTLRTRTSKLIAPDDAGATLVQSSAPQLSGTSTIVPRRESLAKWSEYAIQEMVNEGGMGQIFRADQGSLRRDVAVKKIIPEHLDKQSADETKQAFVSEALVTGFLEHPNIVPVHSLGQDECGDWFFSMKMVRGTAWKHLLHPVPLASHLPESKDTPDLDIDDPARRAEHLDENLKIIHAVCNAVAFAHSKKIIHRDLKPENVMVGAFGEVLVMDWGLAVDVSDEANPTDTRVPHKSIVGLGGTPEYVAPEQNYSDSASLSERTDVFLLGAMLFEILTGQPPNAGATTNEALMIAVVCNPDRDYKSAPQELADICRKALSKDPQNRHANALDFQKSLTDYQHHREAALILARADLEAKTQAIPNLARAVVLYNQALELWPENAGAQKSRDDARTRLMFLETAARRTKYGLRAAVAAIVVGLTVGFFLIRAERNATELQRGIAVEQKVRADENAQKAIASEKDAKIQLAKAVVARGDALLAADRVYDTHEAFQMAFDMFEGLGMSPEEAEWGLSDLYMRWPTPLMTYADMHTGSVSDVFFLPDGQSFLSAGDQKVVQWDVKTGRVLHTFTGHTVGGMGMALSHDGRRFITSSNDKTVKVWRNDGVLPECERTMNGVRASARIALSHDGKLGFSLSTIDSKLWDLDKGIEIKKGKIGTTENDFYQAFFLPDSKKLLTADPEHRLKLWDIETGMVMPSFKFPGNVIGYVCASSDGKLVLSQASDGNIVIWESETGKVVQTLKFASRNQEITCGTISFDKHKVAVASRAGFAVVWDMVSGTETHRIAWSHSLILSVRFSPDDRQLLTAGNDKVLNLWDTSDAKTPFRFAKEDHAIRSLAMSTRCDRLFSLTNESVKCWDTETQQVLRTYPELSHTDFTCVSTSADDHAFFTPDRTSGEILKWDTRSAEYQIAFKEVPKKLWRFSLSPDGNKALILSGDAPSLKLRLVDLKKGQELFSFDSINNDVLAFSSDGKLGLVGGRDDATHQRIAILDIEKGTIIRKLPGYVLFHNGLAFAPDNSFLIACSTRIRRFDPVTGRETHVVSMSSTTGAPKIAIAPNSKLALALCDAEPLRLLDSSNLRVLRSFQPNGTAWCGFFSPDSRKIIWGNSDGSIYRIDFDFPRQYRLLKTKLDNAQIRLAKDPKDKSALTTFGDWFAFRGVWDYALDFYIRAGISPSSPKMASCSWRNSQWDAALKAFQTEHEHTKPSESGELQFDLRVARLKDILADLPISPQKTGPFVALDLSSASNAEVLSTANYSTPNEYTFIWATESWIAAHGMNSAGIADDGRIEIPGTESREYFQMRLPPVKNAIIVTAPKARQPNPMTVTLPVNQCRAYSQLMFLHSSSFGNGILRVRLVYASGKQEEIRLRVLDWFKASQELARNEKPAVITLEATERAHSAVMHSQCFNINRSETLISIVVSFESTLNTPANPRFDEQFTAGIFAISAVPAENEK